MTYMNSKFYNFINECEEDLQDKFKELNSIREYNQHKVLQAMQDAHLSHADFHWSTGYGYGDVGRDKVEDIYSQIFNAEDALVRPSISSGTHALSLALNANLKYGDKLVYISSTPYDTLLEVIGVQGDGRGSLLEKGIIYDEIPLDKNNKMDYDLIKKTLDPNTKMVAIQRSKGYTIRSEFTVEEIKKAIECVKSVNKDIIVMVDNCYGEFVEKTEPSDYSADMTVGSLIKNPGGGLAVSGGYIVGRKDLVERCSIHLTAPGLGKETGVSFGTTRTVLQGIYFAPMVVNNAVKGSLLIGRAFENLGFNTIPNTMDETSDIVQLVVFRNPELVKLFCLAVQEMGAVDSYVTPYPAQMPGYENEIIMAAAGFVDGSSIEISADGPLRDPYAVFYQGGLSYDQCKFALINILDKFDENNLLSI